MKTFAHAALAFAAVVAAPASAAVVTGNTTGAPTYNRLTTLTSLSAVGTAVHYQVQAFTVASAGSYAFLMTSTAFDTFLTLYSGSFNPASPTTNAVALNDDFNNSLTQSGFTQALTAGTSYFAVATGFSNTDFGAYTLSITGPGAVTFGAGSVPEPASWALMIGGFGLTGGMMRRRVSKVSFATA